MEFSKFVKSLDQANRELFDNVVLDINQEGSEGQLKELDIKLKSIKKEIDDINTDRQKISHEAKRCEQLVDLLDEYIKKNNSEENIELSCFRILLSTWLKDLRDIILEEKPVDLLKKKYKMKKCIDNRVDRNNIIISLIKKIEK